MPDDATLGDRLAARLLEIIDIPSESHDEAALAAHVQQVLGARDLGDSCILAGPEDARILLAGHLDTVPTQGNRPGSRDAERVHGLGASDMKGALAVMIELALAGAPYGVLFFPREELPQEFNALAPLFERHPIKPDLALVMEPTDNTIHAGCLGNINAAWTFRGVSGHSARPWTAENAIEKAAAGITHLASHPAMPHEFDGLTFTEVASVTKVNGGIAMNVIPDVAEAHVNFRYAPGRTPQEAEARLHELRGDHGELRIDSNAPSGAVCVTHPVVQRLIELGDLEVAPKQAWTPVADFTLAGIPAVNFGPGSPAQAHRRDESIEIAAMVRSYRLLEALARSCSMPGVEGTESPT